MISSITILDINGRLLKRINKIDTFEFTIPNELIQSGVYFIKIITSEHQIITKKIIKL